MKEDLAGYQLLVAVCGGIAAYKVCTVVSALVQRGAGVTVAMTESATRFIGPVTFQTLSGRAVLTSLWNPDLHVDPQHIRLTDAQDLLVLAPATANIIAKLVTGIADDCVSTLLVSADCPVIVAPAMNDRMWANPVVQANMVKVRERGYTVVGPTEGWLACRSTGVGRMVEPADLITGIERQLKSAPPRSAAS